MVDFVPKLDAPPHWVEAGRRFGLPATALGLRCASIDPPTEVLSIPRQFTAVLGIGDRRPILAARLGRPPRCRVRSAGLSGR